MIDIESRFGLADALAVRPGDVVSLVGAGGKTTTLYGLVGELRRRGFSVAATTTTHMQSPHSASTTPPLIFANQEENWLHTARSHLGRFGAVTVVGSRARGDKLQGLEPDLIDPLRGMADCVIIEADGARGRALKAPAAHEPVIPEWTTLAVVIAGLDVLGRPLDGEHVHRLERIQELTGSDVGDPIVEETIALALIRGYWPQLPARARRLAFLNKVDESLLKAAETTAQLLLAAGAAEVVFGEALHPTGCYYGVTSSAAGR